MLQYSLEVAICWSIFYIIYIGFLRRETFFSMNRYYIMGSLLAGVILPLMKMIELPISMQKEVVMISEPLYFIAAGPSVIAQSIEPVSFWNSWQLTDFILLIYILGIIFMLIRLTSGLHRIYKLYKNGEKTQFPAYTMVSTESYHLPFSFMHCVFFSKTLQVNNEIQNILKHELTHIKSRHTYDVLFIEILNVMFWWNPLIYLFKKELRQIHEFLADAMVVHDSSQELYGRLLLSQSTTGIEIALTHSFFHSHLKQRFIMMYKKKSKRHALLKYLVALPIIMGLVFLFSSLTPINELSATEDNKHFIEPVLLSQEQENENTSELVKSITRKNNIILIDTIPELKKTDKVKKEQYPILETMPAGRQKEVFTNVDEMPKFPDCDDHCDGDAECLKNELMKFIYSNIKYPKEARELGIEGMVVVQFIIDEHGQVIHPEIVRDIGGGIAEEALYVVEMMNTLSHRWTPGYQYGKPVKVLFTLPIRFKLEGDERTDERIHSEKEKVQIKDGFIVEEGKRTVLNGAEIDQVVVVGMGNKKQIRDRPENNSSDHDKIFKVVHTMPLFAQCTDEEVATFKAESDAKGQCPITNCGNNKLLEFVYKNLKYPDNARQLGIEGLSVVQFVIEKDGSITDGKVVRDIGGGTSESIMDMLQLMTDTHKWIPGVHQGKARRVLFTLPVRFKLSVDDGVNTSTPPESAPIPPPPPPALPKNYGEKTYKVVDQMPRFPGCETMSGSNAEKLECAKEKLLEFVYSNVKYPEQARKAKIQGLNVVQFIIEPDGSIHFAKMLRNIGGGTDKATMQMMDKMMEMEEKWTPGVQDGKPVRFEFTLPVRFTLEDNEVQDESPLIIIDGENIGRMNQTETLNNIDVNSIESISVLKDEKALEKYGEEGRFGVIEVSLKNGSEINYDSKKEEKNVDNRDPSNLISNSLSIENVKIYPNPAQDVLNVSFDKSSDSEITIKLVNIEGKLFQTEKSQQVGVHFEQSISISKLNPSMFILQIEQDGKVYSTPFVKAQ